jgi:hypothetical protein
VSALITSGAAMPHRESAAAAPSESALHHWVDLVRDETVDLAVNSVGGVGKYGAKPVIGSRSEGAVGPPAGADLGG